MIPVVAAGIGAAVEAAEVIGAAVEVAGTAVAAEGAAVAAEGAAVVASVAAEGAAIVETTVGAVEVAGATVAAEGAALAEATVGAVEAAGSAVAAEGAAVIKAAGTVGNAVIAEGAAGIEAVEAAGTTIATRGTAIAKEAVGATRKLVGEVAESAGKTMEVAAKEIPYTSRAPINEGVKVIEDFACKVENIGKKPMELATRRAELAGELHPVTEVPYEKWAGKVNGKFIEGTFPKFESAFECRLPENLYKASDKVQFKEVMQELKTAIENDPGLKEKFSARQLKQIGNLDVPDGYVVHHNHRPGLMQLVDADIHKATGHTGGRSLWGGGAEFR